MFSGISNLYTSLKWKILDIENPNKFGSTRLMRACIDDDESLVKELIDNGANINAVGYNSTSVLMLSIIRGRSRIASLLIKTGADVNIFNNRGLNALTYSLVNEFRLYIRLILEHSKIDVFAKNKYGYNALFYAYICRKKGYDFVNDIKELMLKSIKEILQPLSHDIIRHIVMEYF